MTQLELWPEPEFIAAFRWFLEEYRRQINANAGPLIGCTAGGEFSTFTVDDMQKVYAFPESNRGNK